MPKKSYDIPAHIVGLQNHSIGIIRGLSKLGMPIITHNIPKDITHAKHSRYVSRSNIYTSSSDMVLNISENEFGVVIPSNDPYGVLLDSCLNNNSLLFGAKTSHTPLKVLLDKTVQADIAMLAGAVVPRCYSVNNLPKDISWPIIVKPKNSLFGGKDTIFTFDFLNDLETEVSISLEPEKYIAQPILGDGKVIQVETYRAMNGEVFYLNTQIRLQGNKKSSKQKLGVVSTLLETVSIPELEKIAVDVSEKLGFFGPMNHEFIQHSDGKYYYLETNCRFGANVYLDVLSGVNVPAIHYLDLIGESIDELVSIKPKQGVKMFYELPAIKYFFESNAVSFFEKLKAYSGNIHPATFSFKDPMPFVTGFINYISKKERVKSSQTNKITLTDNLLSIADN